MNKEIGQELNKIQEILKKMGWKPIGNNGRYDKIIQNHNGVNHMSYHKKINNIQMQIHVNTQKFP